MLRSKRLASRLLRRARSRHSAVLAYHSIADVDSALDPHLLSTPPDEFRHHLRLIIDAGFEVVTVSEFAARCNPEPPPGLIAFSFDDGLLDNLTTLAPILEEFGVSASVYVSTGIMGQPYPWAPETGLRLMTPDEVAQLARRGVEIGAHSVTHPDMARLPFDECLAEMVESRERLEEITGKTVDTFAFPFACAGGEARRAAREAGFKVSLGYGDRDTWPLDEFPRIPISARDTDLSLALKIARRYEPLAGSLPGRAVRRVIRRLRGARNGSGHGSHSSPVGEQALDHHPQATATPVAVAPAAAAEPVDDDAHSDRMLATGARAARDTFIRFGGELTGKLASLALFIAMARFLGDYEVGIFVFGLAWVQIATIIVELGYDTYLMKNLVGKRDEVKSMVSSAIWWKLRRAIPITAISLALIWALDYPTDELYVVGVLTIGLMFDSVCRTLFSAYSAFELGSLVGVTIIVQRTLAAVVGIGLLAAGAGVVSVAGAYTLGAGVGLAISLALFRRRLTPLQMNTDPASVVKLRRESRPFAANEIVRVLLDRIDAVLLSIIATQVAVGLYGSAYRLLESTFFIGFGIVGAFAAMYVYLGRDTSPTIGVAYGRSIKLLTVLLMPAAVALGLLATPIVTLFFGEEFSGSADPLTILAPATVLMGLAIVSSTLLLSRRDPKLVVQTAAAATITNVVLCLALIPTYAEVGAAIAMATSALVWAVLTVGPAIREVGGINAPTVFGSAVIAGAAMAAVLVVLPWPLALPVGLVVYAGVVAAADRLICPGDLSFVVALVRRRGGGRGEGVPPTPPVLLHEETD